MKKFIVAAALAAATLAAPAMAADNDAFVGPRIGLSAGVDDVTGVRDTTDVVYGVDAGIDVPVGDKLTVGVEAFSTNLLEDTRTIGAAARVGYALNSSVLGFARVGYTNFEDTFSRNLDGLTAGGGLEFAVSDATYAKVEYRYSDFEADVGNHGALVGIGFRF